MKKIYLAIAAAVTLFGSVSAQVTTTVTAPNNSNATTSNRGPNGTTSHTTMRGVFLVPGTELSALSPTINSFGFVLSSGVSTAASGSLTVYLMNTTATTYTLGTSWTTATVGATQVYSGVYNIPVGPNPATIDFTLPTGFPYIPGNGLVVAYEYTGATTASTAAVYSAFNVPGVNQGASAASNTFTAPTTLGQTAFRPQYRFQSPNTYTNEISASNLTAEGKSSIVAGTAQTITAIIQNASNIAKTNIGVGLGISGVTTYTAATLIPSLAAGQSTMVSFAYTPTVIGVSNMTIGVASDQNNINNATYWTQDVTCNNKAVNPPTGTYTTPIGYGTGSGIIATEFTTVNSSTLTGAVIGISSNTASANNSVYVALMNSTGSIVATSQTITLTAPMLGTAVQFSFAPQNITAGTIYYIGLAQPSNTLSYAPYGTQASSNTPQNYYTAPIAGGSVTPLGGSFGYFKIEEIFAGACGSVGINELKSAIALNLYPNPTVNGKTSIAGLEGTNVITVYNMLGQVVSTISTDKEVVSIDLSAQMAGNYLVRITNSNNQTKTVKVINN
ncbi:MAG: T9SS type A sorting domain-containing protein [Bacteroidetes bacterium]|nr:T9SS type A sorting domain-containing protein [Bacteroidota bacterium]